MVLDRHNVRKAANREDADNELGASGSMLRGELVLVGSCEQQQHRHAVRVGLSRRLDTNSALVSFKLRRLGITEDFLPILFEDLFASFEAIIAHF